MKDKYKKIGLNILTKKDKFLAIFFLLLFVVFSAISPVNILASNGAPSIISYQGRLTDSSGNLLGGSGATYYFRFSIWNNPGVGLGTKLWPSGTPGTTTSTVSEGVFNVNIGDTANGYPDTLNYNFNDNDTVYLQVEVSADNSTFETLAPRQQITSSGFAINANTVGGYTPAQSASGNQIPVLSSGNLILGGTSPQLTASGANALVVQGGSTGDVQFFSSANKITSAGNMTIAGSFTVGSFSSDPGGLANGTVFYNSTSHKFKVVENGTTKILCNTTDAGCGASGGSTSWSSIIDPASNLALSMSNKTSTFTYGNSTAAANLFNLTDSANNTGTGTLFTLTSANGSALNPFSVTASSTNALFVSSSAYVGVGTTTPGSKLTVVGGVQFASLSAGVVHSNSFGLISSSAVVLTSDVSGILPVSNGGTGTSTLPSNGVLYSNGSSALSVTSAGGSAQILQTNGSSVPSFVSIGGDASLAVGGNLTLANTPVVAGTYGSSTQSVILTVDSKGRLTAVSTTTISGLPPTGAAGGDLSGSYPNPTVARINGISLGSTAATAGNLLIGSGSSWISQSVSGDATISATGILGLRSVGTANTFGSASQVPVFTTDAQGRVTAVSNTSISIKEPILFKTIPVLKSRCARQ